MTLCELIDKVQVLRANVQAQNIDPKNVLVYVHTILDDQYEDLELDLYEIDSEEREESSDYRELDVCIEAK